MTHNPRHQHIINNFSNEQFAFVDITGVAYRIDGKDLLDLAILHIEKKLPFADDFGKASQ